LPDEGYRYQDTIYNDAWLKQEGLFVEAPPCEPIAIDRPEQAFGSWSRFDWGRRPYAKVLGARPQDAAAEVRG
jgi:cysteine synthase A